MGGGRGSQWWGKTTAAIHGGLTQQIIGEQISHWDRKEGSRDPKRDGNTRMGNKKGCLSINAPAGASWSRRAESHTCNITQSHQKHTHTNAYGDTFGDSSEEERGRRTLAERPPVSQPFYPFSSAMKPLPAPEGVDLNVTVTGAGTARPACAIGRVWLPHNWQGSGPRAGFYVFIR